MKGKKVETIKLDHDHRIYVYSRKVIYKERRNGKLVTKVVAPFLTSLLESELIDENIKKKIAKILGKSGNFLNRG